MTDKELQAFNTFRDDLAEWWMVDRTADEEGWHLLDEGVKDFWRKQSRSLLEFLAEQGVMIKTPDGMMALKDLM